MKFNIVAIFMAALGLVQDLVARIKKWR